MTFSRIVLSFLQLPSYSTAPLGIAAKPVPAPYDLQARPLPAGENFARLLPVRVGDFRRVAYKSPGPGLDGEATYRSEKDTVFMLFSRAESLQEVALVMSTIRTELLHVGGDAPLVESLETDPAYLLLSGKGIAFFAWSRGLYLFSADCLSGRKEVLDRFMQSFPY
jgi:hypothetical protein